MRQFDRSDFARYPGSVGFLENSLPAFGVINASIDGQQVAVIEFRYIEFLSEACDLVFGRGPQWLAPGPPLVGRNQDCRLKAIAEFPASVFAGRERRDSQQQEHPAVAEGPNSPRPDRAFLRVEQHFGLAPCLRSVGRSLQKAGFGQVFVVGKVEPKNSANNGAVGQDRLSFAGDAVHTGLKRVGTHLFPGLAGIGRTEMHVMQIEPRHVVLGIPAQQVHHFLGSLRPAFDWAGRLSEAGHQVTVGHDPRSDPTGVTRRLRRVIDRLPLMLDG